MNTHGLNPRQARIRRQIEALTKPAIDRLSGLIASNNEQVALGACREVLDRNLGRARQVTSVDVSVQHTADAHVAALLELARQAREGRGELPKDDIPSRTKQLPVIDVEAVDVTDEEPT